jgi:hypothetical protein
MSLASEDRWVIVSVILSLTGVVTAALLRNPVSIGITAFVVLALLLIACRITNSNRLSWLLIYGAIAGIGELWSDWIHVVHLHSLVYTDYFGLRVLASPLYMPVGWCITVVQFGYLALRLAEHNHSILAIALPTLFGMLIPPWYEQFAAPAGAWYYPPHGIMLSHTPLWVIPTYGGCIFGVASAAIFLFAARGWRTAIFAGIFASASFMFWSVVCFALLG